MNASCRACLSQEVHLYTNEETEKNEILSGLLNTFTALTGFETHPIFLGGVFNLCEPCEARLKLCNEFREMCLQSYTQLGQQFLKVEEVDKDEEITVKSFSVLELNNEEFSDSVVSDEIETVESFDSKHVKHKGKVATINSNKRLEKYSEESVKKLIDELNIKLSKLKMCVSCNYIAVKCVDLQLHMVKKHPYLNDNWCNKCNQLFDPSKEHEHQENILICKLCGKIAKNRTDLVIHYQAHIDNQNYDCDLCDKSYTTKCGLRTHYNLHMNVSYKCKFCPRTYNHSTSLRRHLTKHTQGDLQNDCKICDKSFNNPEDLDNHDCEVVNPNDVPENSLVETDAIIKEEVEILDIFDSKIAKHEDKVSTFTNNKRLEKNSNESALKGRKKISCDKCDRSYTTKSNLNEHYKSHIIQSYACQFCPNTYKLGRSLRRHLLAHSHQVECETCKKRFDNQEDLENHDCINEVINPSEVSENSLVETEAVINEEIEMEECFDSKIVNHEDKVSTFTNYQDLEKCSKESALKGGKKFSCDKCDKSYTTKSNLNEHYKSHIIQSYACQFCPNTYKLERSLRRHLIAHSHQVECETCKKRFDNQEDLENHDCINEVINPSEVSENSLVETEAVINEEIEMEECFDSKIVNHEDKVSTFTNYQDLEKCSKESALKGGKKFSCDKCDKSYTTKSNLNEHYKSHTISSYACQFCPNIYKLARSLRRHLIAHSHQVECETCKKKFKNQENLENHDCTNKSGNLNEMPKNTKSKRRRKISLRNKYYLCSICGKQLCSVANLKIHMDIHTGVKPFKCRHCDFRTRFRGVITNHERRHTGEKPYQCNVCQKTFNQQCSLRLHSKTHQGDLGKLFPCQLCEKRYYRKIDLQYHMRLHTGEKPYRCNLCPKAFKQSSYLKDHLEIHRDVRPYICAYCGEGFNARFTLKNHELIHKGEKPYKCEICNYAFRKADHLKVHMKQHNK